MKCPKCQKKEIFVSFYDDNHGNYGNVLSCCSCGFFWEEGQVFDDEEIPTVELTEVEKLEKEIQRLKIKCNSYAKRLVNEGYDDVSWEVTKI